MTAFSSTLRRFFWALLVTMWLPTLAFAAGAAAGVESLNVPVLLVLISLGLSSLAGGTTLAMRFDAALRAEPGKPLARPWLFCASHMLGSWTAGTMVFLINQHLATPVWLGLAMVVGISFMGAKGVELLIERYLPVPQGATAAAKEGA